MKNILVTGSAGFIGSHLCERLLDQKHRIVCIDNFDNFYPRSVKEKNIAKILAHNNASFHEADIRNQKEILQIFADRPIDIVIHLAARAGVRPSIQDPLLYVDVNVMGTAVILEAMRQFGVKRMLFASSSSVYGNNSSVPFSEKECVDAPISPYAATKKSGELMCFNYHHLYGFDISCLRFFTVYGPRQRPEMAIHKFLRQILKGDKVVLYGDGSSSRDYTFIDDILDGIESALAKLGGYNIYNLGNSHPIALKTLINSVEAVVKKKAIIEYLPAQPGDVEMTHADISRAKTSLNYSPKIDIEEGIRRFYEWILEQND